MKDVKTTRQFHLQADNSRAYGRRSTRAKPRTYAGPAEKDQTRAKSQLDAASSHDNDRDEATYQDRT